MKQLEDELEECKRDHSDIVDAEYRLNEQLKGFKDKSDQIQREKVQKLN